MYVCKDQSQKALYAHWYPTERYQVWDPYEYTSFYELNPMPKAFKPCKTEPINE